MKKLVLLLVLSFLTSGVAYTFATSRGDDPQFKVTITGSDHAGFDVDYSWPGEGQNPKKCTVKVEVTYSGLSKKSSKTETFEFEHQIHNSGSGWAYFDGKSALDDNPISASILSKSCSDVN